MRYNYISYFKVHENFNIEIEFDKKYKFLYKGVSDFYFNKNKDEGYYFSIIDFFSGKVLTKDYELINNAFGMKYTKKTLDEEINGKMNLLQIEGSLTLYILYKSIDVLSK